MIPAEAALVPPRTLTVSSDPRQAIENVFPAPTLVVDHHGLSTRTPRRGYAISKATTNVGNFDGEAILDRPQIRRRRANPAQHFREIALSYYHDWFQALIAATAASFQA